MRKAEDVKSIQGNVSPVQARGESGGMRGKCWRNGGPARWDWLVKVTAGRSVLTLSKQALVFAWPYR